MIKKSLCILLLFSSINFFGQEEQSSTKKLPISIYAFTSINNQNSFSAINKRLRLSDFDFIYVRDIPFGYKLFSSNNFKERTANEFVYDHYIKFQDDKLFLDFLRKNDPTRRPWQRFQTGF